MRAFGFTQVQAQAILDMPLRRLTALERKQLQNEQKDLKRHIAYLEDLLADVSKILGVIRDELLSLRPQHADSRRTQVVERMQGTLTSTDLLPDMQTWVALGANGELRRQTFDGISRASLRQAGRNAAIALLTANTRDHLFIFAADGRCHRLGIHEIPQEARKHLANFTDYGRRDAIATALALPRAVSDESGGYLFLVTHQGSVKRVALSNLMQAAARNLTVMRVAAKEQLGWAFVTPGNAEVILVTRKGRSIRFPEEMVRAAGLAAGGVGGINLKGDDKVVAAMPATADGELLTVTTGGFVKRTRMGEFSTQGRGGSGIIAHKVNKRTGDLVGAAILTAEHDAPLSSRGASNHFATFVTQKGVAKPLKPDRIPPSGRYTQGVQAVDIAENDTVAAVQVVSQGVLRVTSERDNPPLPSSLEPQMNGRGNKMGAKQVSEGRERTTKAADGQKRTQASKGKRTTETAGKESTPAKGKTRPPANGTARKPKTASTKRASAAKETPTTKASTGKGNAREASNSGVKPGARRTKQQKTAPKDGAQELDMSTASRRAAETAKHGKARAATRTNHTVSSEDQLVQGRLIEDAAASQKPAARKSAARSATEPKNKVARVSSVTKSQKKISG